MNARLPKLLLPFLLLVPACDDDAAGPRTGCETTYGCQVEGVDLALLDVDVVFDRSQAMRQEVDANVVLPGATLPVRIELVNRGSEISTPAVVNVSPGRMADSIRVPPLEPGAVFRATAQIIVSESPFAYTMLHLVQAHIAPDDSPSDHFYPDADAENNRRDGERFHIRVPVLTAEIPLPDTMRALEPYVVGVQVTNSSPFAALHEELEIGFCFVDDGYFCDDPGEITTLPPVMAGETRIVPVLLEIPHDPLAIDWVDGGGVLACIVPPGLLSDSLGEGCIGARSVQVRPNVEASCDPRVLSPPDSFDPNDPNPVCRHQSDHYLRTIVALDAQAGERFAIDVDPGLGFVGIFIVDLDGTNYGIEDGVFTASEARRYYIAASQGSGAGRIHVTRLP